MACAICQTRRPRRWCPGVRGDICTVCCGAGREVSVSCPLDCEYLREARKREKLLPVDPDTLPNRDIAVSEEFLQQNEPLLVFLAGALAQAALRTPEAVDLDIREAIEASIRTQRTLQSGLYYETLPANPLAAGLCRALQDAAAEFRKAEAERLGLHKTLDSTILGVLVFLQHFGMSYDNGRRRGRAFLDALLEFYPVEPEAALPAASSLLLP